MSNIEACAIGYMTATVATGSNYCGTDNGSDLADLSDRCCEAYETMCGGAAYTGVTVGSAACAGSSGLAYYASSAYTTLAGPWSLSYVGLWNSRGNANGVWPVLADEAT